MREQGGEIMPKKPIINRFFLNKKPIAGLFFILIMVISPDGLGGEKNTLTLSEALMKTLKQHPELPAYQALVRSARSQIEQAEVGTRPELSVQVEDALGSGDFQGRKRSQTTLDISWLLEKKLIERRIAVVEQDERRAIVAQRIRLLDVLATTKALYLEMLRLQERKAVAMDALKAAQSIREVVRERHRLAAAPQVDLARANAAVRRQELELDRWQSRMDRIRETLAAQWGAPGRADFGIDGTLRIAAPEVDSPNYGELVDTSPYVKTLLVERAAIEKRIGLVKEEARNRIRLTAGVRRHDLENDYSARLGFSIPLGSEHRNDSRIAALRLEEEAYRIKENAKKLEMKSRIRTLTEQYQVAYQQQSALESEVIPALERAVGDARDAYRKGIYGYQDWWSVQKDWDESRMALIEARYEGQSARAELERITGSSIR